MARDEAGDQRRRGDAPTDDPESAMREFGVAREPAPTAEDLEVWDASFERVRPIPEFLPRFYELFRRSSDEVAARFVGTDFERQACVLAATLAMVGMAAREHAAAETQLRRIAAVHDRSHLDIPPHLYPPWRECLVRAVAEHDPLWSAEVERAWRRVVDVAIRLFLAVRDGDLRDARPIGGNAAWAARHRPQGRADGR